MKYVKKPILIEAIQIKRDNIPELIKFSHGDFEYIDGSSYCMVNTLEGTMQCHFGDYLVKGIHGEFYACKKEVFEESYELVEE